MNRAIVALLAATTVGACTDNGPEGTASIDVTMRQTGQIFTQASGVLFTAAGVTGATQAVDPDTVASLVVRITRIEALSAVDSSWVEIALGAPVLVDLTDLPAEDSSPIVIATGDLTVGEYTNLRFFVDSAAVTFTGPLSLGAAASFEAGVVYQVTIPSATQTGIKTDAAFTVSGDGADVDLLFSTTATFQNVTATGTGSVMMAPVIKSGPPTS